MQKQLPPSASPSNEPSPIISENQPSPVAQATKPGAVRTPIVETAPTFSPVAPEQPPSPPNIGSVVVPVVPQATPQSYFKPCTGKTYNVIVASGFPDYQAAYEKIKLLRNRFPQFRFKLFDTVGSDGVSNQQYAVIVGHGLNQTEADALVRQIKNARVADDAYFQLQDWASPCEDRSRVER